MNKDNQLILSNDISPQEDVELLDVEEIENMSMSQLKRQKDILSARRQQVMLRLDGRKLIQAERIVDAMDITLDKILNSATDESITALDLKCLAEAYEKLNKSLNMVSRLDTVNSNGNPAEISLEIRFKAGG